MKSLNPRQNTGNPGGIFQPTHRLWASGLVFISLLPGVFIFPRPAFSAEEVREIKIIAAVSSSFRRNPEWKRDIFERVTFANSLFEPRAGIRFKVKEYTAWEPRDEMLETGRILEDFQALVPAGAGDEIMMGFHKLTKPVKIERHTDRERLGTAHFMRGYVILRDPFHHMEPAALKGVLAHELGHVFGAVHVRDDAAIMYPSVTPDHPVRFDEENLRVIRAARGLDLREGPRSLSSDRIDEIIKAFQGSRVFIRDDYFEADFRYLLEARDRGARRASKQTPGFMDWLRRRSGARIADSSVGDFNAKGMTLYAHGQKDLAITAWTEGLKAEPANPDLNRNLAAAYLEKGAVDWAVERFDKLRELGENTRAVQGGMGMALLQKKEFQRAAQYFYEALEKPAAPRSESIAKDLSEAELRFYFAQAYLGLKQGDRAAAQLNHARQLEPGDKRLPRALAEAYLLSHGYPRALEEIQNAMRLEPDDMALYLLLARAREGLGEKDKARMALEEGLAKAEKELKAVFYFRLADFWDREGKSLKAFELLRKALDLNPEDPQIYYEIALIYRKYKYFSEAKRLFRRALEIKPDFEAARKALE